jgi:hypothetical protein
LTCIFELDVLHGLERADGLNCLDLEAVLERDTAEIAIVQPAILMPDFINFLHRFVNPVGQYNAADNR